MWKDGKFRSLSTGAKLVFNYLLTGPETTNIPGVVPVGFLSVSEGIGEPFETVSEWLEEVSPGGLARYDRQARLAWVPNRIKYDPPTSPTVVKGWAKTWGDLPDSPLLLDIYKTLHHHVCT